MHIAASNVPSSNGSLLPSTTWKLRASGRLSPDRRLARSMASGALLSAGRLPGGRSGRPNAAPDRVGRHRRHRGGRRHIARRRRIRDVLCGTCRPVRPSDRLVSHRFRNRGPVCLLACHRRGALRDVECVVAYRADVRHAGAASARSGVCDGGRPGRLGCWAAPPRRPVRAALAPRCLTSDRA